MKFYYDNFVGNIGCFSEDDLIRAIYSAWNIEADLYLLENSNCTRMKGVEKGDYKLIFSPHESNEYNSELLESFGYYMKSIGKYREIVRISDNKVCRYEWKDVKRLY